MGRGARCHQIKTRQPTGEEAAAQTFFTLNTSYPINFFEANRLCNSSTPRGQLASAHSIYDDNTISDLCASPPCWIGLTRPSDSNQWQWTDNTVTDHAFQNKDASQPTFTVFIPTASQACVAWNIPSWFVNLHFRKLINRSPNYESQTENAASDLRFMD